MTRSRSVSTRRRGSGLAWLLLVSAPAWASPGWPLPDAPVSPGPPRLWEEVLPASDPPPRAAEPGPAPELEPDPPDWTDLQPVESFDVIARTVSGSVVERRLTPAEVATLPGALADPLRAVQSLPGVSRAPFGSGQLMVRGNRPEDSSTLVDGLRVPVAYHFTGISTVINPDALEEVVFHPGSWGVRYGRSLGGVVDLRTTADLPAGSRSYAAADLFQATAFTEHRLGRDTGFIASARRSWIDAMLTPALALTGGEPMRAPRFYDTQVGVLRQVGQAQLSAMLLVSDDRFRVVGAGQGTDPLRYDTSFQKLNLRWSQPLGRGWRVETGLLAGPERRSLVLGEPASGMASELGLAAALVGDLPPEGAASEQAMVYALRHEWVRMPGTRLLGLRAGLDLLHGAHDIDYGFGENLRAQATVFSPAIYAEPQLHAGPLQVIPGVRWEGLQVSGQTSRQAIDPRLTARLTHGDFALTGGLGRFSQLPAIRELLTPEGSGLGFARVLQASLGAQHDLGPLQLGLLGYRHWYSDLVVGREGSFRFDNSQLVAGEDLGPFANEGTGGAAGVEAMLRYRDPWWTVWLSGTFGRAWRIPRPGAERRPSQFDQPVILNVLASRELPAGFRLGARARFATGAPMTDVVSRIHAIDSGAWLPVHGPRWGARAPAFFSLDTRIDREIPLRSWTLTTWFELQNATNRRNVEIPGWSSDYSRFEPVVGLPLLPAFGVKGAW